MANYSLTMFEVDEEAEMKKFSSDNFLVTTTIFAFIKRKMQNYVC